MAYCEIFKIVELKDITLTSIFVCQMHLTDYLTSTVVFYRTRVYQMQPRNGQNWHFSVGKYVHHNRESAKIGIRAPLKVYVYFRFVSETAGI